MKIAVVLGTRPEIIKLSSVIRRLGKQLLLIHTNQHYSPQLDQIFFDELALPRPAYQLGIGSGSQADQTAQMLQALEPVLVKERPAAVIVQGDTNSVLAGALAAAKLNIPIAHVEAGLRSGDRTMPEEVNRIVTDHLSEWLFPPTVAQAKLLRQEGIAASRIAVVGNTVVDAVMENAPLSEKRSTILPAFGLNPNQFLLLTAHRPSNVDNRAALQAIIVAAATLANDYDVPVIFPAHPRTAANLKRYRIRLPKTVRLIEPVGYLDMLRLLQTTKLLLTDSGGLQEEACILRRPCVILRDNTERPETLKVGAAELAGADPVQIRRAARRLLKKPSTWPNPFGDGRASERIIARLLNSV